MVSACWPTTLLGRGSRLGRPDAWTSKNQYNISPFFENDRWSARVTYSALSTTQVDRGNYLPCDYESLDTSLGFRINTS